MQRFVKRGWKDYGNEIRRKQRQRRRERRQREVDLEEVTKFVNAYVEYSTQVSRLVNRRAKGCVTSKGIAWDHSGVRNQSLLDGLDDKLWPKA